MLAFALAFGALCPASRSVSPEIIVVAVNDTIINPIPALMPFTVSGVLYIPADLIKSYFNLTITDDRAGGNYIISGLGTFVIFDMINQTITDRDNVKYTYQTYKPILKGGRYYLPAAFMCDVFGLSYKRFGLTPQLVRIRVSGKGMTDAQLTAKYKSGLTALLTRYFDTYPDETGAASYGIIEHNIYLIFSGDCPGENTAAILDKLAASGKKALFVLRGDRILEYEALVRRIYVEGHAIALGSYSGAAGLSAENLLSEVLKSDAALKKVIKTRPGLVFLPPDSAAGAAHISALEGAGYRVWRSNITVYSSGPAAETAAAAIEKIKTLRRPTVLEFHDAEDTASILKTTLEYLKTRSCAYIPITGFTAPPIPAE